MGGVKADEISVSFDLIKNFLSKKILIKYIYHFIKHPEITVVFIEYFVVFLEIEYAQAKNKKIGKP